MLVTKLWLLLSALFILFMGVVIFNDFDFRGVLKGNLSETGKNAFYILVAIFFFFVITVIVPNY